MQHATSKAVRDQDYPDNRNNSRSAAQVRCHDDGRWLIYRWIERSASLLGFGGPTGRRRYMLYHRDWGLSHGLYLLRSHFLTSGIVEHGVGGAVNRKVSSKALPLDQKGREIGSYQTSWGKLCEGNPLDSRFLWFEPG